MSLLTVDVGGANQTVIPFSRAGNAERRPIGGRRYAFAGNERSMIRDEKIVAPVAVVPLPAATVAIVRALFANGASVDCEGDLFNNGGATIACWGEITDEIEVGGVYVPAMLTLHEVGGASAGVAADDAAASPLLLGWYDAQGANYAALGLANLDPLTPLWPDETANGNDALAGNGAFPGYHHATAMNGFPGVRFDFLGNNQRGYSAVFNPTQGEAFIVMRRDVAWPNDGAFWGFGQTAVSSHVPTTAGGTMRDHFGSTRSHSFTIGTDPTVPFVYHVRAKAGQWRCWVNGVLKYSTSINTVSWQVPAWGEFLTGGAFYVAYIGWIGELKLYSGFLDSVSAATEVASLKTKWGIA